MSIAQTLGSQGQKPAGALGWVLALAMPVMFRPLYAKVARLLDLQPHDDVLDVACGSGNFLRKYAPHVSQIAGIDHSEIEIRLAARLNGDRVAAGPAEFVHGDATALPWQDGRFTAVTCNCVSCFAEPQRALQEMRRVLRRPGRAVHALGGTDKDREHHPKETDVFGMPIWTGDEVRQMMADAGFTQVSASYDKKLKMWLAQGRTE